jgi:hypothetical protein
MFLESCEEDIPQSGELNHGPRAAHSGSGSEQDSFGKWHFLAVIHSLSKLESHDQRVALQGLICGRKGHRKIRLSGGVRPARFSGHYDFTGRFVVQGVGD